MATKDRLAAEDQKVMATLLMQGMLAHPTRYKPRLQDQALDDWHAALAREACDMAQALGRELRKREAEDLA